MTHTNIVTGGLLRFTKDLSGVCSVARGDVAVYLGRSQARILTGRSAGWLVTLSIKGMCVPRGRKPQPASPSQHPAG